MKTIISLILLITLTGCFHIPFTKDWKKEAKSTQSELVNTQTTLRATQSNLDAVYSELQAQKVLAATAATHVAVIKEVGKYLPPTRPSQVTAIHASAASQALPEADIVQARETAKVELDTTKTTDADLEKKYQDSLKTISKLQDDLKDAESKVTKTSQELTEVKADAGKKAKETSGILDEFASLKWWILGLGALFGVVVTVIGSAMSNMLTMAKGVSLLVLSIVGMFIPILWYLIVFGSILLIAVVYIVIHWKREQSIADNAVGILEEAKQELSTEAKAKIKAIAQEYWGTSARAVERADKLIKPKLKKLNFL